MIVCPNCKGEIEDNSRFCDQCGQALAFCESCGRVGVGRRCNQCGGLMVQAEDYFQIMSSSNSVSSMGMVSLQPSVQPHNVSFRNVSISNVGTNGTGMFVQPRQGMPKLMLYNESLGIRIVGINGAIIGRRQGPYAQFLQQQKFVSGQHAQLLYKPDIGWCIADRNSSNGTMLNDHQLQPDIEMSLKNGDVVMLANVVLKVSII